MDPFSPDEWNDEVIDRLIDVFPEVEDEINREVYYNFSAHLVFDMILFPRVMEWAEQDQTEKLIKLSDLLEEMLSAADKVCVTNVVEVSFLESLVLEGGDNIPKLTPYFHPKTLDSLQYWIDRYGKRLDA